MSSVPIRDLRNHTRSVIDRVRAGEPIELTASGEPIATIVPINRKKPYLTREEVLNMPKADRDLLADLAALGDDSTDLVGPVP